MNEKEYAALLILKFLEEINRGISFNPPLDEEGEKRQFDQAKRVALVAVDVLIQANTSIFWERVKMEILKMNYLWRA